MDVKVQLLMFSLLIIIIMLFSNKLYNNSNLIKSRGYFLLSIIILLVSLISVSLICKKLKLADFGFDDFGISQSTYTENDREQYNKTDFNNFLHTKSFVLILIFLFFYIFIKLLMMMIMGKGNIKDLENIEIVIYVLLAFFTPLLWLLREKENTIVNNKNGWYVLILFVITLFMVFVFRNKTKDFFDNSTYGYICPRNNFKDVLIEGSLICPKKIE